MTGSPRLRLRMTRGGLVLAMAISGCARESHPPPAADRPSKEEISAYLQAKAEDLYPHVQGLRLTGLRFSEDRTLICGWVSRPGQGPLLFTSADQTPGTVERSIGLPLLDETTPTARDVRARDAERAQVLCQRSNLMPEAH